MDCSGCIGGFLTAVTLSVHTLLQSFLHVEERVGDSADSPHDLKAGLLMVLEHPVSVECQQVVGHAAHIYRLNAPQVLQGGQDGDIFEGVLSLQGSPDLLETLFQEAHVHRNQTSPKTVDMN